MAGIVGYYEHTDHRLVRRQPAGSLIPLVLSFGPTLEILDLSHGTGVGRRDSFIAGFMPGHATTAFQVGQHCLQIYLTPLGAYRLLCVPGRELAHRVLDVADVLPVFGDSFRDQLWSAGTWLRRFDMVDAALLSLAARGPAPEAFVEWMWRQIQSSHGTSRIGPLIGETGWSHRHVTSRFTDQIGLAPKVAASVVRFEHAVASLQHLTVADVAARHGYADQSHLSRDFVRFAGETPDQLRLARRPTAQTAIGTSPGNRPQRH